MQISKLTNNFRKLIAIVGLSLMAYGVFWVVKSIYNLDWFGPMYTKEDLIKNYEKNFQAIEAVKAHIEQITPPGTLVHIRFEGDKLRLFNVKGPKEQNYHKNRDLTLNDEKTQLLLKKLKWDLSTLKMLKQKLDKANCISISNKKPVTIGWQVSGIDMLYYKIFDQNLSDRLIKYYNQSCAHIFYKNNVVLEHRGGATNSDCF